MYCCYVSVKDSKVKEMHLAFRWKVVKFVMVVLSSRGVHCTISVPTLGESSGPTQISFTLLVESPTVPEEHSCSL